MRHPARSSRTRTLTAILLALSLPSSLQFAVADHPETAAKANAASDTNVKGPPVSTIDDRDVYILTSRIRGRWPKLGVLRHASIAICPRGVSPIVYENGIPVTNCAVCVVYGTQTGERGFKREGKRIDVSAMKLTDVCASTIEARIRSYSRINIPLLKDCRHDVIAVTGLRGAIFRQRLAMMLN